MRTTAIVDFVNESVNGEAFARITMNQPWFGVSTVNLTMSSAEGLSKGDQVEVEVSGGRKNPIVIRK